MQDSAKLIQTDSATSVGHWPFLKKSAVLQPISYQENVQSLRWVLLKGPG